MNHLASQLEGRRVLVTGASGFIGTHLCQRLRNFGADLHAISRSIPADNVGGRWWQADLTDPARTTEIVRQVEPDLIYHLASRVVGSRELAAILPTLQANLVGAVNLMTAAAENGCPRFVLAGSLEESQASSTAPSSPYAAAKQAATGYARMFHTLYGLQIVHLRIAMVYGPNQSDTSKLIPYVIQSVLRGETPRLSSGRREVDWIYVDDVVDAMIASAHAAIEGCVSVDVGSGMSVSISQIAERLCSLVDSSVQPDFGAIADRPQDRSWTADVAKAQETLDWRPQTDLENGLRNTVEWYRSRFTAAACV